MANGSPTVLFPEALTLPNIPLAKQDKTHMPVGYVFLSGGILIFWDGTNLQAVTTSSAG